MKSISISTKLFATQGGLGKALGEKEFTKLNALEQVSRLGRLFQENVSGDKDLSEQLMRMIRSAILFATGTKTLTEEEMLKLTHYEFELMGRLSRKKVALARFKLIVAKAYDELPDTIKQELLESGLDKEKYIRKQIREIYKEFTGVSNYIIDSLWENYNFPYDARLFLMAFNVDEVDTEDSLFDVCSENGSNPDVFIDIGKKFPFLGINVLKIEKEMMYQADDSGRLTGNYLDSVETTPENPGLDSRNGFINPNWFLYDVDIDSALKLWGTEKTKYIFGRYFYSGIRDMGIAKDLHMPEFYNLSIFRLKIDEDAEGNKKKLVDMAQHISEWEIPENLAQSEFAELVKGLLSVISDFKSSGEPKRFDHPIQTRPGAKNYSGAFSGSRGFENTHIIYIQPLDKNGKRVLRFSTELGQDVTLFVMIQTSYFLKNKKLLPAHIVWREIYEMYNKLSLEGVERFDPSSMKEQYDTMVRKVVWPLSAEHKKKNGAIGKPHNMLLYGVYGTGKSQLLAHLIAERKYTLPNGEEIHLEANVINIGIMEFADLLVKSVSSFRKRLSDIHENTGRPIILVIEDIDTIVKEQGIDSDPVSQAMTTIFEGIGSLPVIVIASTNNPEILPPRHLRPNRLDTLVAFEYPIKPPIIESIFHTHWKKKGLDKILKEIIHIDYIESEILPKIAQFTPSHISALCLAIYEALEFEDIEKIGEKGVKKIIDKELGNCLVPIDDMKKRESSIVKWRSGLSASGTRMGF